MVIQGTFCPILCLCFFSRYAVSCFTNLVIYVLTFFYVLSIISSPFALGAFNKHCHPLCCLSWPLTVVKFNNLVLLDHKFLLMITSCAWRKVSAVFIRPGPVCVYSMCICAVLPVTIWFFAVFQDCGHPCTAIDPDSCLMPVSPQHFIDLFKFWSTCLLLLRPECVWDSDVFYPITKGFNWKIFFITPSRTNDKKATPDIG